MTPNRQTLPDQDVCADPLGRGVPTLIYDSHGYADVEAYDNARSERDRLRAEVDALKANQCPDAEVCKTCPCADEDDACFPGERLRAEVTHLKEEQVSLVGSLGDAQAEVERLRRDMFRVVQRQEGLRSAVRRMARFAVDAHDMLTPGMKAGVGEARSALQACVEVARASDDEHRAPEGIDGARRFDLAGQPLCFSCGKTQSEHEGGIECARPSRETDLTKEADHG